MKDVDRKNKLLIAAVIILSILVLVSIYLIFRPHRIEVEIPYEEEVTVMEIPGIGEPSSPIDKKEPEVNITVTPQYHGSFYWEKIGEWLKDPTELLDNTSVTVEGNIKF